MLDKPRILSLPALVYKFKIKQEHSCKILYFKNVQSSMVKDFRNHINVYS